MLCPLQALALILLSNIGRIKDYKPTPDKPFVLGLPTGSSPEIIYKILVQRYKEGEISFRNVVTFNMVSLLKRKTCLARPKDRCV